MHVYNLSTNLDSSENINVQWKQKNGMIKDVASPINGQMYNKSMLGENCADQLQLVYSTWELWNGGSTCFVLCGCQHCQHFYLLERIPTPSAENKNWTGNYENPTELSHGVSSTAYWEFQRGKEERHCVKYRQLWPSPLDCENFEERKMQTVHFGERETQGLHPV